jgi:hypothetical protein
MALHILSQLVTTRLLIHRSTNPGDRQKAKAGKMNITCSTTETPMISPHKDNAIIARLNIQYLSRRNQKLQ